MSQPALVEVRPGAGAGVSAAGSGVRLGVRTLVSPAALVVYLALAFAAFAGAWRDPFANGIGVRGDPSQFMWFLTWYPYAATHGLNPFFTTFADYPQGSNLLWNTSMPLVAYALWPVTATLGALVAYDLMETLGLALSAWTAFLLLRRYVSNPVAAGVGGLLYGFSPYMIAQSLGHPHLTVAFMPPLILLVLDEIVRVQRRRPVWLGVALALACAAQFFISEEVLVVTGLTAAVLIATGAALWPREALVKVDKAMQALIVGGGLTAVLLAVPVLYQLTGPQRVSGLAHEPNVYVNDLFGFWVPSPIQWIAPERLLRISARFTGNSSEWNSYLGAPLTLLLGFIAVRNWRSGWVRVAALAGAVVAILSLGVTLHTEGTVHPLLPVFAVALLFLLVPGIPARALVLLTFACWFALWRFPLLDSILPARLMLLVYLLSGLLLAVFVDGLIGLGWRRAALGAGAVAVALAPLVPSLPYASTTFTTPAFFASGGAAARIPAGSVVLIAPMTSWDNVEAMLWQADSGMRFRIPEGYLFIPAPPADNVLLSPPSPTRDALYGVIQGKPSVVGDDQVRQGIRNDLAEWHVRTVVVGPMPNQGPAVALLTWALGRSPEYVGGVYVWWDVDTSSAG